VALSRYPNLRSAGGLLRGADYAGTVTFALTGTITAAQSGLDVFGSTLVGILTSVGGGTIRDAILLHKQPFWTEETEYIWMGIVTGLITFFCVADVGAGVAAKATEATTNTRKYYVFFFFFFFYYYYNNNNKNDTRRQRYQTRGIFLVCIDVIPRNAGTHCHYQFH